MRENEKRPDGRGHVRGEYIGWKGYDKDTKKYRDNQPIDKTKRVYDEICKESSTINMLCCETGYTYGEVYAEVMKLVKMRLVRYWGKDTCFVTRKKAYYFEITHVPQKKYPEKRKEARRGK